MRIAVPVYFALIKWASRVVRRLTRAKKREGACFVRSARVNIAGRNGDKSTTGQSPLPVVRYHIARV